jgi:hypothetical protein
MRPNLFSVLNILKECRSLKSWKYVVFFKGHLSEYLATSIVLFQFPDEQPEFPIVTKKYFVQFMFLEGRQSNAEILKMFANDKLDSCIETQESQVFTFFLHYSLQSLLVCIFCCFDRTQKLWAKSHKLPALIIACSLLLQTPFSQVQNLFLQVSSSFFTTLTSILAQRNSGKCTF